MLAIKYCLSILLFLFLSVNCHSIDFDRVNLNSKEGIRRFERSKYRGDFFSLISYYSPQQHATECGLASARIVLNKLYRVNSIETPLIGERSFSSKKRDIDYQYHLITEENILDKVNDFPTRADIRGAGVKKDDYIGIDVFDMPKLFRSHGFFSEYYSFKKNPNDFDIKTLISKLKMILNNEHIFIIGFFNKHISPIVAYDQVSNSVLILDVEQHNSEFHWVSLKKMVQDMSTLECYGYVLIYDKTFNNRLAF